MEVGLPEQELNYKLTFILIFSKLSIKTAIIY